MHEFFRLLRLPFLPLPLLLWTTIWPVQWLVVCGIIKPLAFLAITVLRAIGVPFVFIYSLFSGEDESLGQYLRSWGEAYEGVFSGEWLPRIGPIYDEILTWLKDPKCVSEMAWMIPLVNGVAALAIAVVLSEAVRNVLGVTAIIVFIIFMLINR